MLLDLHEAHAHRISAKRWWVKVIRSRNTKLSSDGWQFRVQTHWLIVRDAHIMFNHGWSKHTKHFSQIPTWHMSYPLTQHNFSRELVFLTIIAFYSNLKTTSGHVPSQVEWNYWFNMQTTNGNPQGTNSWRKVPSRESITLFSKTNFQEWKSLNACMYECRPYSSGKLSVVDLWFISLLPIFFGH